jgi:hypothetical protein
LYDLVFDPNETNNLVNDPEHAAIVSELKGALWEWKLRTRDPVLRGPVQAPEGAIVTDPDSPSPRGPTVPWPPSDTVAN